MARHIYACPLRWSDMDVFGHVNNVNFLRYLEEARIDFTFTTAGEVGERAMAEGSVVARHEIDYLVPLVYRPEPVTIETWVSKLGRASFTVTYEVKDVGAGPDGKDKVYARAATICVPYDLAAGRPRRLTPGERAFLAEYLEPQTVSA
ncbi:acyl-CoA thioesterase [Streptacidiphilus pinicola]|uniref:Acyl-CoA thioesterase n=1 Tax=Streptacidiphilus pinicola TaxID=2219663 RepID=A0A2X0ITF3_9ACTN|nr:thioesterase family protein [Streptacidiphilus pinicola]RAG86581.1 acyl-CoA thioesterase [Streptacidiphilus pinicola]